MRLQNIFENSKINSLTFSLKNIFFRLIAFGALVNLINCANVGLERGPAKEKISINFDRLVGRNDGMGLNKARQANLSKKVVLDYGFRNIASAFPDNGKQRMISPLSLKPGQVRLNPDSSPWLNNRNADSEMVNLNKMRFSNVNAGYYSIPLDEKTAAQMMLTSRNTSQTGNFYEVNGESGEDLFEPNNDLQHARDISGIEGTWLGLSSRSLDKPSEGIQNDRDFYKIHVNSLFRILTIDLRYQHYLGNIDLYLLDSQGKIIYKSVLSSRDDEFMKIKLEKSGDYYILVDGSNKGNFYDLMFKTEISEENDDAYEDNDQIKKAFDLSEQKGHWLSEGLGEGVAGDDDYYKVSIKSGATRILVDLRYLAQFGDIDLQVLNSQGKVVASSSNTGNDEFIDFDVKTPGNYFLRVYPFGNPSLSPLYDLRWETLPTR